MSAATIIAEAFGEGADLYSDVLGVDATATAAQLRKAYYRKALQFHPDKKKGEDAKSKFQAISMAYDILKDPEKRAEYDESGELVDDDEMINKTGADLWKKYFSQIFGRVSTKDIDDFAAKYKCSEEEEQDVLKYYGRFKGDLNKMLDCVMLSEECDKARWLEDFINPAIEKGDVEDYSETLKKTMGDNLVQEIDPEETETDDSQEERLKNRKRHAKSSKKQVPKKAKSTKAKSKKREKEAAEAEALMARIRNRNSLTHREASFESMLSGIKGRYGVNDSDPIGDDDEFEKIQARMLKKAGK